ncbi:GNAT family N-acetyltransferase [Leptospira perolatii]|nr:GNAT family N-acetyltransferase [Leptospira perolatii]
MNPIASLEFPAKLLPDCLPTKIPYAFLESGMGEAWLDRSDNQLTGAIRAGDFLLFVGDFQTEFLEGVLQNCQSKELHILPSDSDWWRELSGSGRFKTEIYFRESFDWYSLDQWMFRAAQRKYSKGIEIRPIDPNFASFLLEQEWSRDQISNFESARSFCQYGVGFVVIEGLQPIASIASYLVYKNGVEVQVDTHPQYRGQGLAKALGIRMFQWGLEQGKFVHWDAISGESAGIARTLGLRESRKYECMKLSKQS